MGPAVEGLRQDRPIWRLYVESVSCSWQSERLWQGRWLTLLPQVAVPPRPGSGLLGASTWARAQAWGTPTRILNSFGIIRCASSECPTGYFAPTGKTAVSKAYRRHIAVCALPAIGRAHADTCRLLC